LAKKKTHEEREEAAATIDERVIFFRFGFVLFFV